MAFIELVEAERASDAVLAVYRQGEAAYGKVLETWKAIAHNPAILQAYLPYVRAIFGPGALEGRIKDLVAVRICRLLGCRYSLSHRVASARRQGVPDEDLVGLVDPDSYPFSDAEKAALLFAEELTLAPPRVAYADSRQGVSPTTMRNLKKHFTDPEIAELVIVAGLWNFLARFHRVMDFDLDMPPPPAGLDLT